MLEDAGAVAATSSATELSPRRVVLPGVFRPRSDTWLLARTACRQPLPEGARVLELCAGPAVAGIAVARKRGRAGQATEDVLVLRGRAAGA
jgi:methylase of polypeptide subunit release factors